MDDLSPEDVNEILELIYSGQKLMAIKRYREARGTDLMEAKQFIEQLTDELREKSPERFKASKGRGCATGLLFGLLVSILTLATSLPLLRAPWRFSP